MSPAAPLRPRRFRSVELSALLAADVGPHDGGKGQAEAGHRRERNNPVGDAQVALERAHQGTSAQVVENDRYRVQRTAVADWGAGR
jgi:hypothetical protein